MTTALQSLVSSLSPQPKKIFNPVVGSILPDIIQGVRWSAFITNNSTDYPYCTDPVAPYITEVRALPLQADSTNYNNRFDSLVMDDTTVRISTILGPPPLDPGFYFISLKVSVHLDNDCEYEQLIYGVTVRPKPANRVEQFYSSATAPYGNK